MISQLGKNIKYYREEKGWNLLKLKEKSKLAYSTLHAIENGKTQNLSSKTLIKVADALDVSPSLLINNNSETITDISNDLSLIIINLFNRDYLTLDNIKLNKDELIILEILFKSAINSIRNIRKSS